MEGLTIFADITDTAGVPSERRPTAAGVLILQCTAAFGGMTTDAVCRTPVTPSGCLAATVRSRNFMSILISVNSQYTLSIPSVCMIEQ